MRKNIDYRTKYLKAKELLIECLANLDEMETKPLRFMGKVEQFLMEDIENNEIN